MTSAITTSAQIFQYPIKVYSWRRHIDSRFTILRVFFAPEDQGRQDKKQWKEKEPCFATDFENHVAAVKDQNGNQ